MQAMLQEAVRFAFKDRSWILKLLIGGVLGLIPIVNIVFLIGYSLTVLRDAVDNKPAVLPEWTCWGDFGKAGLYGLGALGVYGLPLILLGFLSNSPGVGKFFYVLFVIVNFLTIPIFTLALVQWHKDGNFKGVFAFKTVWQNFVGQAQLYVLATLALVAIPFILSLALRATHLDAFHLQGVMLIFPGAFIQLLFACLWFWLSVVGARIFGQIYVTAPK